jgi:hypothetical protein
MFHQNMVTACLLCCLAAGLGGCGVDSDTLSRIEQMARQQQGTITNLDNPLDEDVTQTSYGSEFSVPFPDRMNPFEVGTKAPRQTPENVGAANVTVLGFAKLGQQQAILRIGEQTRFVVVGDHIGELEVLGITPPRVRLKNGNLVWDASMFHNRPQP